LKALFVEPQTSLNLSGQQFVAFVDVEEAWRDLPQLEYWLGRLEAVAPQTSKEKIAQVRAYINQVKTQRVKPAWSKIRQSKLQAVALLEQYRRYEQSKIDQIIELVEGKNSIRLAEDDAFVSQMEIASSFFEGANFAQKTEGTTIWGGELKNKVEGPLTKEWDLNGD